MSTWNTLFSLSSFVLHFLKTGLTSQFCCFIKIPGNILRDKWIHTHLEIPQLGVCPFYFKFPDCGFCLVFTRLNWVESPHRCCLSLCFLRGWHSSGAPEELCQCRSTSLARVYNEPTGKLGFMRHWQVSCVSLAFWHVKKISTTHITISNIFT